MAGFMHKGLENVLKKHMNDVVILSAFRTPLTRAKKGGLKDAYPEEMLYHVLKATLAKNSRLDPREIQDVAIGSVLQELGGAKAGRMAANHAGIPSSAAFHTINRQCSSGMAAITSIAHNIAIGAYNVGIGGGMESMTRNYGSRAIPTVLWPELPKSSVKDARDCIMSMGITSENVSERYGIGRADQDAFAVHSHQKAAKAHEAGLFKEEIVPVKTKWRREETDTPTEEIFDEITVTEDDGIRAQSSVEKLGALKPAFKNDGSSTAGNSSQVTDGAAATLLMSRQRAHDLGLQGDIVGKWAGTQVVGCAPDEMGIGPAVAIPKLLEYTGVKQNDVGVWEINEAFASQALYCIRKLGIAGEKVNPRGGAIALGHPLGATGCRQLATLLPELEHQSQEIGVISMCVGTGMGLASLIVRE